MGKSHYQTSTSKLAEKLSSLLAVATVREAGNVFIVQEGGDPLFAIVAVVSSDGLDLRLPTVEWTQGSHGPAPSSTLWRRFSREEVDGLDHFMSLLGSYLEEARSARRAQFEDCAHCKRSEPIEHRIGASDHSCCLGCASKHHGVVY